MSNFVDTSSSSVLNLRGEAGKVVCTDLKHLNLFLEQHPPSQHYTDPKTIEMFKYYQQARKEHDFKLIDSIRRNKEFGNPYILTKVVDHFKINQAGSNFSKEVFDPNELTAIEFEEGLKRRRVDSTSATHVSSVASSTLAGTTTGSIAAPNGTTAPTLAPGPVVPASSATAAALAAAVAAIQSSIAVGGAGTAGTGAVQGGSGRQTGEPKRKTKWG